MTYAAAAAEEPRLYSQIEPDERGNFHYVGDLLQQREPFAALCKRIERHLASHLPHARFSVRGETFAGGRQITAELLDHANDLTDRTAKLAMLTAVRDQLNRFGFIRSNALQGYLSCFFYSDIRIASAYWAALARRRGQANAVENLMSLAAFRHRIQPGDKMKLIVGPSRNRAVGTIRTIIAVRSVDIIFEGKSSLRFPRSSCFSCDGRLVRIAFGSEEEPDAHLLYEWFPSAA